MPIERHHLANEKRQLNTAAARINVLVMNFIVF